jgi:hypothetical protein
MMRGARALQHDAGSSRSNVMRFAWIRKAERFSF